MDVIIEAFRDMTDACVVVMTCSGEGKRFFLLFLGLAVRKYCLADLSRERGVLLDEYDVVKGTGRQKLASGGGWHAIEERIKTSVHDSEASSLCRRRTRRRSDSGRCWPSTRHARRRCSQSRDEVSGAMVLREPHAEGGLPQQLLAWRVRGPRFETGSQNLLLPPGIFGSKAEKLTSRQR